MRVILQASDKLARQAEILAKHKATCVYRLNQHAGSIRTQFVTNLPAQDMIYLRKEQEAKAYLLAVDPEPSQYPMIQAELGITGTTEYEIAQTWLNLANQWVTIAASLETPRLSYIAQIMAAQTFGDCDTLLDSFRDEMSAFY
jgi:hypothetical protein